MTSRRPIEAYRIVSVDPARATGLPGVAYTDPSVLEAERERVLRAGWLPVARIDQLANPGDYACTDVAGAPVVALRDGAGTLRVLSAICRHRGMPVVSGEGRTDVLTCPYHLWRYGLDGALLSAPAMRGSEVFNPKDRRLPELRSEAWGGWLWVNADGGAGPLAESLLALSDRLAPLAPETMTTVGVIEMESPWNWKVMVENFLESYHHIGPHARSLQLTHPGLGTFEGDGSDAFTVLENPPANPEGHGFVVACVFPIGLMFFTEDEAPVGAWYQMDRLQPDRFRLRIHLLASPALAGLPGFAEGYRQQVAAVHAEDIAVCEGVQSGVSSPDYRPGPLSPLERPLWRFHRHLARRMSGE